MNQTNPLTLLRGPLIILSVASALLIPYLAQFSSESLALLSLLVIGLCVTLVDAFVCAKKQLRVTLNKHIGTFVLDDALKAIFDPEVGLIATSTGSFIGSSAMYSLASTEDQRVRLLQSGLWVRDPEIARNVLYQPGGIKFLLPPALLEWLQQPADVPEPLALKTPWPEKCPESSDDEESATALYEDEKHHIRQNEASGTHNMIGEAAVSDSPTDCTEPRHSPASPSLTTATNMSIDPPMPYEVLGAIIMENTRDKLSSAWKQLPDLPDPTTLGITGGTAALLLLLQMRTSHRARDILMSVVQSLTTMGLSSLVMASGATFCASVWKRRGEKRICLASIKDQVTDHMKRNWKSWVAAIVLLYLKRRQKLDRRY